jgi:hypothetical protein
MKNPSFPRRAASGPGLSRGEHTAPRAQWAPRIRPPVEYGTHSVPAVLTSTTRRWTLRKSRDLQFLFNDGDSFFHDERRNFTSEIDCITEAAWGFEVTSRENEGRYTLHKTILGDPYQNCLLVNVRVEAPPELLSKLKMYVLCAPHLKIGGWHHNREISLRA